MKCNSCKMEILEYDFCPHCGVSISDVAKKIEKQKNINLRLETLLKLIDVIDDPKTLKIINDIVKSLK